MKQRNAVAIMRSVVIGLIRTSSNRFEPTSIWERIAGATAPSEAVCVLADLESARYGSKLDIGDTT